MTGDAESYGCCLVCGATRAVEHLERDAGVGLRVVCPNPACPSPDGRTAAEDGLIVTGVPAVTWGVLAAVAPSGSVLAEALRRVAAETLDPDAQVIAAFDNSVDPPWGD